MRFRPAHLGESPHRLPGVEVSPQPIVVWGECRRAADLSREEGVVVGVITRPPIFEPYSRLKSGRTPSHPRLLVNPGELQEGREARRGRFSNADDWYSRGLDQSHP